MKKNIPLLLIALNILLNAPAQANTTMWQTADQQGAKLLSQGKSAEAANTFTSPHWQGVAQFKSAQYKAAIKTFKSLPKTSQNYYNLGNALARAGNYKEAIEAYKESIKLSPTNEDAAYNKKIIEDLLKKQQKEKNKKEQDKKEQNKKEQDKKEQDKKEQDKKEQDRKEQNKKEQDKKEQDKKKQDKKEQDKKEQDKKMQNKQQNNKEREKSQAQKQQLERVPDNPGGLLKQKFLRDYLKRHPEQSW